MFICSSLGTSLHVRQNYDARRKTCTQLSRTVFSGRASFFHGRVAFQSSISKSPDSAGGPLYRLKICASNGHEARPGPLPSSPLVDGIKAVAVGKKGSQDVSTLLAQSIVAEVQSGQANPVQCGAFFAALYIKGLSPTEQTELLPAFPWLSSSESLAHHLLPGAPSEIVDIAVTLLRGDKLQYSTAKRLGRMFFDFESQEPWQDVARALCATVLRVRYESIEEYKGLVDAMAETIRPEFRAAVPVGPPVIQFAEPFDGVTKSYIITPLIARHFQQLDYRVVSMVGRTSGPKYGTTLLDVVEALNMPFLSSTADLETSPEFGWAVRQQDVSPQLDRWVDIRRTIIKRPFLATIEKYLDPCKADILVTSAFHPSYTEKMVELAERASFPAAVVVRKGLEGSLSFSRVRAAEVLCTVRQPDGRYIRNQFALRPPSPASSDTIVTPSAEYMATLIRRYARDGASDEASFDDSVGHTLSGLSEAVAWIRSNAHASSLSV